MDKKLVYLSANEQKLICPEPFKIASGTVEYVEAHFELGDNWDSFDSIKAVWWSDFKTVGTILNSQGVCQVPYEVVIRRSEVMINLVGSVAENDVLVERLTTFPVLGGTVLCDARVGGDDPHPATPSQVEQFADRVQNDADRAETAASNAEASAQNASDSATSAHNSAQSAHDDKVAIEEAIAEVIQQIEDFEQVQVVVNTLPPSSQATSDFTDGVLTLGIPQGVKGDTGNGIQSIRKTGTSGLVDTYTITYTDGQTTTFTVTNGAKGDTGNGISSIVKTSTVGLVDTYTITYTDGNTTTFTVTNGEKGDKGDTGEVSLQELEDATIVQTLSDNEPYNYRRTNNGQGSGHREYDEIVGASVGWNQLAESYYGSTTINGITITKNSDGTYTVNGTATAEVRFYVGQASVKRIGNHKFYIGGCPSGGSLSTYFLTYMNGGGGLMDYAHSADIGSGKVGTVHSSGYQNCGIIIKNGTTVTNLTFKPNFTDLTLALGSTIADYVYSLEQSTAGSGVAWLKSHFPRLFDNGYQPFDSGSIKSVSGLTAHEMVGVNVWDEEWEVGGFVASDGTEYPWTDRIRSKNYIESFPSTQYYINHSAYVYYYDADKNFIRFVQVNPDTFTTPSDCRYIRFSTLSNSGTTYKNDICINLSDTSINGQYFPYEKHTYPLDSSVELRGKYVLDNGQLKAVGDVYPSSGQIGRNFAEADLGTLDWTYGGSQDDNTARFYALIPSAPIQPTPNNDTLGNITMKEYAAVTTSAITNGQVSKGCAISSRGYITIRDNSFTSTSASAFKSYISGKILIYPLATPTTEQAAPYTSPQWCDSHGTEEYVGSELPVGHNTEYPMTLVDTMPSANGTYEPRVTIANGKRTITWQSV